MSLIDSIITDYSTYCYINKNDMDELNLKLLFEKDKSKDNIINIINNYKPTKNKKQTYNDSYYIFTSNNYYKYYIDFNSYKFTLINNSNKATQEKVFNMIINEIKLINNNTRYEHYIFPFNEDIYDLRLRIFFKNDYLEFSVNINPVTYPFTPPKFKVLNTNIHLILKLALDNINIFKLENWKSTITLEWIAINIHKKLEIIIDKYLNKEFNSLEYLLGSLDILILNKNSELNINFEQSEIPKVEKRETYWKAGTGYGCDNDNYNAKNYIEYKENKEKEITNILENIYTELSNKDYSIVNNYGLLDYLVNQLDGITLLDLNNKYEMYTNIFKLLHLLNSMLNTEQIKKIVFNISNINQEEFNELYMSINALYELLKDKVDLSENTLEIDNDYITIMKPLQYMIIEDMDLTKHLFSSRINETLTPKTVVRIMSELSALKTSLPLNYESSIWVRASKSNINFITFMISGPKNTPYEDGMFEFHAFLPPNYPNGPPKVLLKTTGNKTVRFNPNLYNCGKVCLSLLGTWAGREDENWNPKTSTFLQVLISIQSLIFVDDPYFNEPGYERTMNTEKGKEASKKYNNNIKEKTLQWAIHDQINNPSHNYEEIIKEHFKHKKDNIMKCYNTKL